MSGLERAEFCSLASAGADCVVTLALRCCQVGDLIVVDGGMVSLEVISKAGPDVVAKCVDPGIILSRANLTFQRDGQIVRARNAMLPVLSSKVRSL